MSRRVNPAQQQAGRDSLRAQLEAPTPISYGVMPLGPGELTALARATGLGLNAVKALVKIAGEGGPRAASKAVLDEGLKLFAAGRKSLGPAAIKQALHGAYDDVVREAKVIASRARSLGKGEGGLGELAEAPQAGVKYPKAPSSGVAPTTEEAAEKAEAASNAHLRKFVGEGPAPKPETPLQRMAREQREANGLSKRQLQRREAQRIERQAQSARERREVEKLLEPGSTDAMDRQLLTEKGIDRASAATGKKTRIDPTTEMGPRKGSQKVRFVRPVESEQTKPPVRIPLEQWRRMQEAKLPKE